MDENKMDAYKCPVNYKKVFTRSRDNTRDDVHQHDGIAHDFYCKNIYVNPMLTKPEKNGGGLMAAKGNGALQSNSHSASNLTKGQSTNHNGNYVDVTQRDSSQPYQSIRPSTQGANSKGRRPITNLFVKERKTVQIQNNEEVNQYARVEKFTDGYQTLANLHMLGTGETSQNRLSQPNNGYSRIHNYEAIEQMKGNTSANGFYHIDARQNIHDETDSNSIKIKDMRKSQQQRTQYKLQTAKSRVNRQKEDQNIKLSKQLKDLTKIGKDLKKLAKEQKVSQIQLNKMKSRSLVKESEVRKEWQPRDKKEQELIELMKKYPGMRFNKNLQNQLELLRKKAALDEDDPEFIMKGHNKYQLADTGNLLAPSEDNKSNYDITKNLDVNLDALNSSEGSQPDRNLVIKAEKKMKSKSKVLLNLSGNHSLTQLEKVKMGLKACKGKQGFFNPMQAFNCLNDIQIKEDPQAYEPEVALQVKALRKKADEAKKILEQQEQDKLDKAKEVDKALFDFDEDIDNLEEVDDRYPITATAEVVNQILDKDKENDEQFDQEQKLKLQKMQAEDEDRQIKMEEEEKKKKEKEQAIEESKQKIAKQFHVKKAERPKMDDSVLKDLERMKQAMNGGATANSKFPLQPPVNLAFNGQTLNKPTAPINQESSYDEYKPVVMSNQKLLEQRLRNDESKEITNLKNHFVRKNVLSFDSRVALEKQSIKLYEEQCFMKKEDFSLKESKTSLNDVIQQYKAKQRRRKLENFEYKDHGTFSQKTVDHLQQSYDITSDEKAKTVEGKNVGQQPPYKEQIDCDIQDKLHESVKKFLSSRHQRLNSSNNNSRRQYSQYESQRSEIIKNVIKSNNDAAQNNFDPNKTLVADPSLPTVHDIQEVQSKINQQIISKPQTSLMSKQTSHKELVKAKRAAAQLQIQKTNMAQVAILNNALRFGASTLHSQQSRMEKQQQQVDESMTLPHQQHQSSIFPMKRSGPPTASLPVNLSTTENQFKRPSKYNHVMIPHNFYKKVRQRDTNTVWEERSLQNDGRVVHQMVAKEGTSMSHYQQQHESSFSKQMKAIKDKTAALVISSSPSSIQKKLLRQHAQSLENQVKLQNINQFATFKDTNVKDATSALVHKTKDETAKPWLMPLQKTEFMIHRRKSKENPEKIQQPYIKSKRLVSDVKPRHLSRERSGQEGEPKQHKFFINKRSSHVSTNEKSAIGSSAPDNARGLNQTEDCIGQKIERYKAQKLKKMKSTSPDMIVSRAARDANNISKLSEKVKIKARDLSLNRSHASPEPRQISESRIQNQSVGPEDSNFKNLNRNDTLQTNKNGEGGSARSNELTVVKSINKQQTTQFFKSRKEIQQKMIEQGTGGVLLRPYLDQQMTQQQHNKLRDKNKQKAHNGGGGQTSGNTTAFSPAQKLFFANNTLSSVAASRKTSVQEADQPPAAILSNRASLTQSSRDINKFGKRVNCEHFQQQQDAAGNQSHNNNRFQSGSSNLLNRCKSIKESHKQPKRASHPQKLEVVSSNQFAQEKNQQQSSSRSNLNPYKIFPMNLDGTKSGGTIIEERSSIHK